MRESNGQILDPKRWLSVKDDGLKYLKDNEEIATPAGGSQ
jgi:hypothetical protein